MGRETRPIRGIIINRELSTVVHTSVERLEKYDRFPDVSTGKMESAVEKPVEIVEKYSSVLWITQVIHGKDRGDVKKTFPRGEGGTAVRR